MEPFEYFFKAFGIWFVAFFPLAEIYVAIPAGVATGVDYASVVFWSVFGNYTPILLIHFFYEQLMRFERARNWLSRLSSEKLKARVDKYGAGFVLFVTPWTGVWVMAVTAKVLRMDSGKFLLFSFISIAIYAVGLVLLIAAGLDIVSG